MCGHFSYRLENLYVCFVHRMELSIKNMACDVNTKCVFVSNTQPIFIIVRHCVRHFVMLVQSQRTVYRFFVDLVNSRRILFHWFFFMSCLECHPKSEVTTLFYYGIKMKWFFTRHDSNSCVANALSCFLASPSPQQLQWIKTTFRSTFRILVNKFLASKRFQWHKDVQIFSGCDSSFDLNGCNMQKCVSRCTCWRTAIHVKNATFYCVAHVCRSLLGYNEKRQKYHIHRKSNNKQHMNFIFRSLSLKRVRFSCAHFIWLCIVIFLMLLKIKINGLWINALARRYRTAEQRIVRVSALCTHIPRSVWCGIFSHGQRWNTQMFFSLFFAIFFCSLGKTNKQHFFNTCDYSRRKLYRQRTFWTNPLNQRDALMKCAVPIK